MQFAKLQQHNIQVSHLQRPLQISASIKPAFKWLMIVVGISAAAGYLFTGITKFAIGSQGKYFFLLLFLLVGVQHIFIFPKWLRQLPMARKLVYTLLLGFLIVPVLYVLFTIKDFNTSILPVAAGSAFIFPFMIQACWHYFSGIQPEQPAWCMPEDMQPETRMSLLLLNSIPFSISITESDKMDKYVNIPVTVNPKLNMDAFFCRFMYHQQQRIEAGNKTGWRFYVKKWYGLKPVLINASLVDNGINAGDIIIAERAIT